ncbi:MAG TPA: hypothetical protein PLR41_05185 [Alphaproteobacteria bacterium]|nr:hypothetical protein [Alphaproteobacteria bacterium]
MTALIFHGGHYKTGSTSLQHALRAGEGLLAGAGILYPHGPADGQFSDVQHADLVTDCFAGRFDRVAAYLAQVAEEAREKKCATVLLSSELATSFHRFPDAFPRWLDLASRHFETPRYVFVVRDVLGYARSMYRELVKSGRASFHYDAVRDELARLLLEQQKSIAFFRAWDESRVAFHGFRELTDAGLVQTLVKRMVGYKVNPLLVRFLNTSEKKAQNIAALLLNDVYALLGASMGLDPLANAVRAKVKEKVTRGRLKRAFAEDFAAEIEQAFLDVTDRHVRRVLAETRSAVDASFKGLPAEIAGWLSEGLDAV